MNSAVARWSVSLLAALVVTCGLFYLMARLVDGDGLARLTVPPRFVVDFVRVAREETEIERDRRPPPPQPEEAEPPPPALPKFAFDKPAAAVPGVTANLPRLPDVRTDLSGFAVGDGGTPLVRVSPIYPIRAANRGIEGWVEIEFTIERDGGVILARVVDAEPSAIFNRSALRAVSQWRYRPPTQDGRPVRRDGVRVVIEFQLKE